MEEQEAADDVFITSVADEQSYTLRDAEAEEMFGFSLEESLKRAKSEPLFKVRSTSRSPSHRLELRLREAFSPCSDCLVLSGLCVCVCYRGSTSTSLLGCALVSAP